MSLEHYYARLPKRKSRPEHIIVTYARSINWIVEGELCKFEAYETYNSRVFSPVNVKRLVRMPSHNLCRACAEAARDWAQSYKMPEAP